MQSSETDKEERERGQTFMVKMSNMSKNDKHATCKR